MKSYKYSSIIKAYKKMNFKYTFGIWYAELNGNTVTDPLTTLAIQKDPTSEKFYSTSENYEEVVKKTSKILNISKDYILGFDMGSDGVDELQFQLYINDLKSVKDIKLGFNDGKDFRSKYNCLIVINQDLN